MGEIQNLRRFPDGPDRDRAAGGDAQPPRSQAARGLEEDERHFCVSLAGRVIGIDTMYGDTYAQCRTYLCANEPDFRVAVTEQDMAYERVEARKVRPDAGDGLIETLAVYRKISEAMLAYDTFLMHGAVVATGGSAYLFTAESGIGKTTHIRKWLANLEGAFVVNGDKPLIRVTDSEAIACGTPWCGKENLNTNVMVPLKAIVLMERGEENRIEELPFGKAFVNLLQQTYRPDDAAKMQKTLVLLMKLKGQVRFFRFVFNNLKDDAFRVAYDALAGGKP